MEKDSYQTIENPARGLFKDRGSKFIAFAFPVDNEDKIKKILVRLRSEYHDARHHCYAWRFGAGGEYFRANDDGEPSGTAGKPILGQIKKYDLTNILIVVVRYFGGTLLGTGGLINAYRSASSDALEQSVMITKTVDEVFEIKFPYAAMNDVMKVLKEEQAEQLKQDYDTNCNIRVRLPRKRSEKLAGRLQRIGKVRFNIVWS